MKPRITKNKYLHWTKDFTILERLERLRYVKPFTAGQSAGAAEEERAKAVSWCVVDIFSTVKQNFINQRKLQCRSLNRSRIASEATEPHWPPKRTHHNPTTSWNLNPSSSEFCALYSRWRFQYFSVVKSSSFVLCVPDWILENRALISPEMINNPEDVSAFACNF